MPPTQLAPSNACSVVNLDHPFGQAAPYLGGVNIIQSGAVHCHLPHGFLVRRSYHNFHGLAGKLEVER